VTTVITWYSGPRGATWHAVDTGIGALLGADAEGRPLVTVQPGGGKENPSLVAGPARSGIGGPDPVLIGTTVDFLAAAASRGEPPYREPHPGLRTIGSGWSTLPFHLVRSGPGPDDLAEILTRRGGRIAVPPPTTSDELTFQRVLACYGTSYRELAGHGVAVWHAGYDDIEAAFGRGEVDYLFGATAAPAAVISAIGRTARGGTLLPLPDMLISDLGRGWGYQPGTIPADHYPGMQARALPTVVMRTTYVVNADASDESVYQVTNRMLASRSALAGLHPSMAGFDPAALRRNPPVPLHEGARRAYAEHGHGSDR